MGVEKELIELPEHTLTLTVVSVQRGPAGKWTLTLLVQGEVPLPEGRKLVIDREVNLGGERQRGSRQRGGLAHKKRKREV